MTPDPRTLTADCSRCFALCCVALTFARSTDFAIDKPAGDPCPNLQPDFGCGIHDRLRTKGFPGCAVYDCFGAGQQVSQVTFAGRDWRSAPEIRKRMFAALPVMRQLHELLWYLTEARSLAVTREIHADLDTALAEVEQLTTGDADAVLTVDPDLQRARVNPLLVRTSELVRGSNKKDRRGADLIGAKLAGADLRGANLRGAYLIAANLRGADLRQTDLIGADLRDADVRGADFTGSVFLTQSQVNAARGDVATRLPPRLARPAHW
ncbi:pentapeptide repeat-containing protein [Amycolatopsis jejuensis]|uniref:pentapeptide repeat-containing protein n=1 Tax=Amycolatopsis jejuensis TaxID=330084 RepID=UPI00052676CF|nr:pentapeptide repeat-containing protein [Amycolatopsis jejuensis]